MKRGSALLIVLGMLSFMLFSGIAFSVFMRQTRLPSSFLRRTAVTRQLAKAALAEAVEEIDRAIGDDPHPGVQLGGNTANYWSHCVFTGEPTPSEEHSVSTLTMEGLAYLPPSIINEARYYSRKTKTAKWHKFRFEAGRYAYAAIDVSDCFDVNRILADSPRGSAPSRRITLAHIFEKSGGNGLHGSQVSGAAEDWDEWLEKGNVRSVDEYDRITFSGKMPLVSLADFNLLMGKESFGLVKSPFVDYLESSSGVFYHDAGDSAEDERAEAYRSMTFVTDSCFRKALEDEYDLENGGNQPFTAEALALEKPPLTTVMQKIDSQPLSKVYRTFLSRIGFATLYDYLDEDSLPVSLCIPTVERNPMICALNPDFKDIPLDIVRTLGDLMDADGKSKLGDQKERKDLLKRTVSQNVLFAVDGAALGLAMAGCSVNGLALYPFLHTENKDSYTLDGRLSLFFYRAGKKIPIASNGGNAAFVFGSEPPTAAEIDTTTGLLSVPLQGSIAVPSTVRQEDDAILPITLAAPKAKDLSKCLQSGGAGGRHWISLTYKWEQTRKYDPEQDKFTDWAPVLDDDVVKGDSSKIDVKRSECRMWPLDDQGAPITIQQLVDDIKNKVSYALGMAVWARIRNGKGTVDMVPACVYDDKDQGLSTVNANMVKVDENLRTYFYNKGSCVEGMGRHVMRFDLAGAGGQGEFALADIVTDKKQSVSASPQAVMVADPRYNHNPANWFEIAAGDLKAQWKSNNHSADRDGDIFMSVSDQGYLQSIYELAFLPRLTDPVGNNKIDNVVCGDFTPISSAKTDSFPGNFDETQQKHLMWQTYRPFRFGKGQPDRFSQLGFVSGLRGLKVNPFSNSPEILAAAFANTPCDWSHASTNETANPHCRDGAYDFNAKYAWNAYGSNTKLMWNDLQDVADAYYDSMRDPSHHGDWESAFEDLAWSRDRRKLLDGAELDSGSTDLYSVDKKFLYGFWHDCFAANQQLFLIFVRAEPMMMGGGIAGNAPPVLSSRAVALVWRDPEPRPTSSGSSSSGRSKSYVPHAMRVLFYHPLD